MNETKTANNNRTILKLILDLTIFLAFVIAMDPHATGVAIHEWLATSALAAIVVHLLLSWDWIVQVTRRLFSGTTSLNRINYLLNWLLFFDVTIVMLSGFMISETVIPMLGIGLPKNFTWRALHDATSNLFLILLGLHTALHWNWIVNTLRRYVFQPIGRLISSRPGKDVLA